MSGFDTPRLQLSGPTAAEDSAETWKRFVTATLMAAAALLLCAAMVVILAPLLPHLATASHAAGLNLSPVGMHAHV
jgi:hypothetical protein